MEIIHTDGYAAYSEIRHYGYTHRVTGCSKVSAGCDHCYAETLSLRFGWSKNRGPKSGGRLLDGREWSEYPA